VKWETHNAIPGADDATAKVALYGGNVTVSANRTIGSLATSVGTGGDLTINSGITLTLANGDLDMGDINNWIKGGGNITSGTNVLTINRDISNGLGYAGGATDSAINGANLVNNGATPLQVVKTGFGTMRITSNQPYTGGTTVNQGVLELNGGGNGLTGAIRGTATVNAGATLRLSSSDVTGYGTGSDRLHTIHLVGGTLHVNTGTGINQTLGSAVINMTGGAITGVAGSNLDFFAGSSAINTLASSTTSSISGAKIQIRQTGGLTITVADGAAATDLSVSSVISNYTGFGSDPLIKAGAGTMTLSTQATYTGGTTVNGGVLDLTGGGGVDGTIRGTVNINNNATLRLSNGDATGWGTGAGRLSTININAGGTLHVNTPSLNQTLGNATINMTGSSITGVAGSNLDFFQGSSALNTLASSVTSTISGVTLSPLRQGNTTFTVAAGTTPQRSGPGYRVCDQTLE
jgi:autotransporter-associated beta strand protein